MRDRDCGPRSRRGHLVRAAALQTAWLGPSAQLPGTLPVLPLPACCRFGLQTAACLRQPTLHHYLDTCSGETNSFRHASVLGCLSPPAELPRTTLVLPHCTCSPARALRPASAVPRSHSPELTLPGSKHSMHPSFFAIAGALRPTAARRITGRTISPSSQAPCESLCCCAARLACCKHAVDACVHYSTLCCFMHAAKHRPAGESLLVMLACVCAVCITWAQGMLRVCACARECRCLRCMVPCSTSQQYTAVQRHSCMLPNMPTAIAALPEARFKPRCASPCCTLHYSSLPCRKRSNAPQACP